MRGLSPVAASGDHSSSRCAGLSLSRPLLLRSTGSRRAGSVAVAHGPSCSAACGIFPDRGSNPCPLHWQADSQPLRHQGSPSFFLYLCLFMSFPLFLSLALYLCLSLCLCLCLPHHLSLSPSLASSVAWAERGHFSMGPSSKRILLTMLSDFLGRTDLFLRPSPASLLCLWLVPGVRMTQRAGGGGGRGTPRVGTARSGAARSRAGSQ